MAAEKDKGREAEQFLLDESVDDVFEVNKSYGGAGAASNISSSDIENVEGGLQGSPSSSFISQQWPKSYRETTDSYTIAASPNFGYLGPGPSVTSFGFYE